MDNIIPLLASATVLILGYMENEIPFPVVLLSAAAVGGGLKIWSIPN